MFRAGDSVFGYFEAEDLDDAARQIASQEVNTAGKTRWPSCSTSASQTAGRSRYSRFFASTSYLSRKNSRAARGAPVPPSPSRSSRTAYRERSSGCSRFPCRQSQASATNSPVARRSLGHGGIPGLVSEHGAALRSANGSKQVRTDPHRDQRGRLEPPVSLVGLAPVASRARRRAQVPIPLGGISRDQPGAAWSGMILPCTEPDPFRAARRDTIMSRSAQRRRVPARSRAPGRAPLARSERCARAARWPPDRAMRRRRRR